jgi:spermidine synthase
VTLALSLIFFLSGGSALVFETLWFRQAGLMLGNSVWASSLVMASFMAGLALGNALAGKADRVVRPVLVYAALEGAIGLSGTALVFALPAVTPLLVSVFRSMAEIPLALNATRLAVAFLMMLVPATAMGATLPLLVRALAAHEPDFGRVIGGLYGWNTLGAVVGCLAGESWLVQHLGVRGSAVVAGSLNMAAALAALGLAKGGRSGSLPDAESLDATPPPGSGPARLLAAACLAGAILLGLEVIWFRFLLLWTFGSSLTFAVMLAVVLVGIALGSLGASQWFRLRPEADRLAAFVALLAGLSTALTYSSFVQVTAQHGRQVLFDTRSIALVSVRLMLPTSLLSGALFTLLGKSLRRQLSGDARAAATLTLANTIGATLGALAGGFLLLPILGVERSLFALSLLYGGVAALAWGPRVPSARRGEGIVTALASAALALVLALFPFGLMRNHYLRVIAGRWPEGSTVAGVREGLTETILYLRNDVLGEPAYFRLLANGFSMSSSHFPSRRYMSLFVNLPVALHPDPRKALLISYGVGSTAKAFTDTRNLDSIDVVDISRDILEMGRLMFRPPETHPLDDPRVQVHVEDGRFFLLTTDRRFDIISSEPPPPKNAGIVNLYSSEYFQLVHDRLSDGGLASYWLPVYQMEAAESQAIIKGFCGAFSDCSLWAGYGYEWILLGTRNAVGPLSEETISRQWRDPITAAALTSIGVDSPEDLGALFIADAKTLAEVTRDVAPLDDDHPRRISPHFAYGIDSFYPRFMDREVARKRFMGSAFIRRLWPEGLRTRTLAAFDPAAIVDRFAIANFGGPDTGLPDLAALLRESSLRAPVYWMLGSSAPAQEIARRVASRGVRDPLLEDLLGVEAMADRDYRRAEEHFARAQAGSHDADRMLRLRVFALCLAGEREGAATLSRALPEPATPRDKLDWAWLSNACGLPTRTSP